MHQPRCRHRCGMIIAGLVERVDVGKGYDIQIKLRISATQFFNPDKEPEGIEQAS